MKKPEKIVEDLLGNGDGFINISTAQRMACVAGGVLLLANGIARFKKPSVSAVLGALAGGYLLYRGASGHCHVTAMLEDKAEKKFSL